MGTVVLQTIQYVRSRPGPFPPVILAVDEATNAGLIGASGFEARALAETAKMGLSQHILVQQLNFPNASITECVLTNTLIHEWFYNTSPGVCRTAAADLGDREFAKTVRTLEVGERLVKDRRDVYREYVEPLADPWGFPGLAKKKAERALAEIRQRPEYWTPRNRNGGPNSSTGQESDETPEDDNPQIGI
jgi:hypothetical protein